MEIQNISWCNTSAKHFNHSLLPKNIRGLIIGKSGCGKTTMLLNLLLRPGWLDYDRLYVFGKSLFQPEYKILKKATEEKLPKEAIINLFDNQESIEKINASPLAIIEEMPKNNNHKPDIDCAFYTSSEDVPDPGDLSSVNKNLMIFDDLL